MEGPRIKDNSVKPNPRAQYTSPRARVRENKHNTEGGMTEEEKRAVLAEEDRFARSFGGRYEQAAVTTADGRVNPLGNPMTNTRGKEVKHGAPTHVYTRRDRTPAGNTFTHYHPWVEGAGTGMGARIGASFSGNDLRSAVIRGDRSIRARTQNYVFSLRPKDGKWNTTPDAIQREWQTAYNKYRGLHREVLNRYQRGTPEYNVVLGRLNALASHQATRDVAKAHGYIYTRRKVKGA